MHPNLDRLVLEATADVKAARWQRRRTDTLDLLLHGRLTQTARADLRRLGGAVGIPVAAVTAAGALTLSTAAPAVADDAVPVEADASTPTAEVAETASGAAAETPTASPAQETDAAAQEGDLDVGGEDAAAAAADIGVVDPASTRGPGEEAYRRPVPAPVGVNTVDSDATIAAESAPGAEQAVDANVPVGTDVSVEASGDAEAASATPDVAGAALPVDGEALPALPEMVEVNDDDGEQNGDGAEADVDATEADADAAAEPLDEMAEDVAGQVDAPATDGAAAEDLPTAPAGTPPVEPAAAAPHGGDGEDGDEGDHPHGHDVPAHHPHHPAAPAAPVVDRPVVEIVPVEPTATVSLPVPVPLTQPNPLVLAARGNGSVLMSTLAVPSDVVSGATASTLPGPVPSDPLAWLASVGARLADSTTPAGRAAVTLEPTMGHGYTVVAGDSLWSIARRIWAGQAVSEDVVGATVHLLYAWNAETIGPDADQLAIGIVLDIPA